MYVSETASALKRGQLVLVEGVFALSGLAIASWVNFGMFHTTGSVSWRFPIALQLVFIALLLSLTPFLPESPRYLVKKERLEEASAVMARLMGLEPSDVEVVKEVAVIHAALARDAGHRSKYSANPFSMNKNRHLHRLLIAASCTMITQLTGINVVAFYSTSIFEGTLGYSGSDAENLLRLLADDSRPGWIDCYLHGRSIRKETLDAVLGSMHVHRPSRRGRLDLR